MVSLKGIPKTGSLPPGSFLTENQQVSIMALFVSYNKGAFNMAGVPFGLPLHQPEKG